MADKKSRDLNKALHGVGGRRSLEEMRQVIEAMNHSREEPRQRTGIVYLAVELIRDARTMCIWHLAKLKAAQSLRLTTSS